MMFTEQENRVFFSLIFSWSFNGFVELDEQYWNDTLTATVKVGEQGGFVK